MSLEWKDWNRNDLKYGVSVPLVVILIVVGLFLVSSSLMRSGGFDGSYGIVIGIIFRSPPINRMSRVPSA
jgi:hypothetical protein